ncbi:MAG TPA: hypothetical protein VMV10_27850 [Pirellulales bacterium]|nr:hypothetical protein [Pirellulales bacterium]
MTNDDDLNYDFYVGDSINWVLVQNIERDVCYLYHELAQYSFIMGDLAYGRVFALPYWEFLDLPGLTQDDREFLRDGCLVMILAMAWDLIDGSGAHLQTHVSPCRDAIERLICEDEDSQQLVRTVQLALNAAENGGSANPDLERLSNWVHKRYVRGYFRRMSRQFDEHYFDE